MRRIHDFYKFPPAVGQVIVLRPVYDRGDEEEDWAWFALDAGEAIPGDADPKYTHKYDGRHAREQKCNYIV